MTKQQLLKKVHKLIWAKDDLMDQEQLIDLQALIDTEIIKEAQAGNMRIKQYDNGYIHSIR